MTWDQYFLAGCEWAASKSKDSRTKVGCIIVGPAHEVRSIGYNGFPRGVHDIASRMTQDLKGYFTEHAERNAVLAAAKVGVPLDGCTLYCSLPPCDACARAIIQAGIRQVVINYDREKQWTGSKYSETLPYSELMLREANIKVWRATI